jgi:hypothetical protein
VPFAFCADSALSALLIIDRAREGSTGNPFAANVKCLAGVGMAKADLAKVTDGPINREGIPHSNDHLGSPICDI